MTAGWRECADPVVLAAAVAAGVEVQCVAVDGRTWETGCEDSESFRRCMANDCRYRVPSSWSWSPEPPADVPTGAERYLAERLADPEYRAAYEAAAPVTGDDEWCGAVLNDINSIIHQHCESDGSDDAHCDWVNDLANEVVRYFQRPDVLPQPAPSPVPPWPGAVLSGLCDEDGVPTWLAQAGQVRGEQVRRRSDFMWVNNDQMVAHLDTVWVEVRAPQAVPAPETERVNVLDAIRNRIELTHPEGEFLAVGVELREDGDLVAIEQQEPWGKAQPVDPDGTVEVLKDGEP